MAEAPAGSWRAPGSPRAHRQAPPCVAALARAHGAVGPRGIPFSTGRVPWLYALEKRAAPTELMRSTPLGAWLRCRRLPARGSWCPWVCLIVSWHGAKRAGSADTDVGCGDRAW